MIHTSIYNVYDIFICRWADNFFDCNMIYKILSIPDLLHTQTTRGK